MIVEPWPVVGGPVLALELKLRARRRLLLWRCLYAGWLLAWSAWAYQEFLGNLRSAAGGLGASRYAPRIPRELALKEGQIAARFSSDYTRQLLRLQLILLIVATPALSAGAIAVEKERRTLEHVLTTQIGCWELVAGKLLGRIVLVASLAVIALPLLVCGTCLSGLGAGRLLGALAQASVLLFALASAGVLASALLRRAQDALLGCYSIGLLVYLTLAVVREQFALPLWLGPFDILDRLFVDADPFPRLYVHLGVWTLLGTACLGIAYWRVRATSLAHLEGGIPLRQLLRDVRPPVGDDPIRWKERYVSGLAPLPWLRPVPRWFGLLAVLSFSLVLSGTALVAAAAPWDRAAVKRGNWSALPGLLTGADPSDVIFELVWLGLVLLVLGTMVVAIRCAGTVREERTKGTWDSLLTTPLAVDEIMSAKAAGVIGAAFPYAVAYLLPTLPVAFMGGLAGFAVLGLFVVLTLGGMFMAAGAGIACSGWGQLESRSGPRRPRLARFKRPSL